MFEKKSFTLRFIFSIVVFLFSFFTSFSQWYNPDKVNKKAAKVYEEAYQAAVDGKHQESLEKLNKALQIEPKFLDAFLSRANVYAEMRDYNASVNDFETAMKMDSIYSKTFLLPYSISIAGAGQFDKALNIVNEFLSNPTLNEQSKRAGAYRKQTYQFAINFQKQHAAENYVFATHNLGDSINSSSLEYFPSLTIDGSKMIFTRRIKNDEDFYESKFINGHWSKATPVTGKINTNFNEGAQNVSQDGELMIFTGCNYPEGEGSCDLYMAYKTKNGGWSEPENIGRFVNTEFWESSPTLSPDKRDLYFASSQPGGFGGKDIWVTHRGTNGKWGRAKNLGPIINTAADDACPFIHADNETLYFNSTGHKGYGEADLFFAKKLGDTSWSKPQNLGYPINTIDEEGSLIVASDGKTAYYASDRGGSDNKGGLDIYSFELRNDIRALKTLWVKGKVYDKKTRAGLPSSVELTELNSGRIISNLQTDEDGNYLVTLPAGKDYAFNVNRKGYLFYSDNFSLLNNTIDSPLVVDIPLQPIAQGASVVLKNTFFDVKQFTLKPESLNELDKVVLLMNDNPQLKILISGHTDNVGKPADNMILSNNRAKAVVAYFLSKGIDAKRLTYKGMGETKPIADNNTEAGRALNRRTELSVISN